MSQSSTDHSTFDKNLRSLLDALSMFEREAGLVLDRFGLDADAVSRALDTFASISVEAVRPLAAALGIAEAAAVEALARDVRALLQSDARLRREQAAAAARFDELLTAIEALGSTTAGLADLQSRTEDRLDALAQRADAIEQTGQQRLRLLDEVDRLRKRIDELEGRFAAEIGPAFASGDASDDGRSDGLPAGIKPGGARRPASRTVKPAAGSHKILEGLPTLEPKTRPA